MSDLLSDIKVCEIWYILNNKVEKSLRKITILYI
jgi:hypothetical protein